MLKYLRYLVLAAIAVALIVFALANRTPVAVQAMPGDLAAVVGMNWTIELPLFAVMFGGIVAGVLIGFVWEWVREHKHRVTAAEKSREVQRLERDVTRPKPAGPADDVLALIDGPRKAG
jgi:uncharacterized integral membrane protein